MAGTDWDNHLQLDLMRLKSELSAQSIKVIRPGLGFGHFYQKERPQEQSQQESQHSFRPQSMQVKGFEKNSSRKEKKLASNTAEATLESPAVQEMAQDFAGSRTAKPRERETKIQENDFFYKFVKSYIVDIVFVTGTLLVVLCGIGLAFDGRQLVWNWQELQEWLPIRFLVESSWIVITVGFVWIFLIYWLFFKFVAGHTLGESFIGQEAKQVKASSGL